MQEAVDHTHVDCRLAITDCVKCWLMAICVHHDAIEHSIARLVPKPNPHLRYSPRATWHIQSVGHMIPQLLEALGGEMPV